MKRTKLAAAASLPPGALPPTSTWYEVPRCFACDDPIKSHRFSTSLLQGRTQYTHSSIPGKLGEYIGDGFVVVVTGEDALCRNCMNLLNTMDRLEEELKEHRTRLVANLRRKYGLDSSENHAGTKVNRKQTLKAEKEIQEITEASGDEEWVPNNKKRKVVPLNSAIHKQHCCSMCKMEFSDLSQLMTHLNTHLSKQKDSSVSSNEMKVEGDPPKRFKCGCCTLSFDKKETLAVHMRLHTMDKQQNRPITAPGCQTISSNDAASTKTNYPLRINNEAKPAPQTNAQTIVEMKLIMDPESKTNPTIYATDKKTSGLVSVEGISAKKKDESIPKGNENDAGGKVCLLALWNNGSCSDHPECQKPSGVPENKHSGIVAHPQQAPQISIPPAEMFIPKIVVQQSENGVPQVVVSQSEFKMPEVVSHPHYQMGSSLIQQNAMTLVPNVPVTDTHYMTITQASSTPQVHINSDTCNSSGTYNPSDHQATDTPSTQMFLPTRPQASLTGNQNEEPQNLQGGTGTLPTLFSVNKESEIGQKNVNPCGRVMNEQTSVTFSTVSQLPCKNIDVLNPVSSSLINDHCQSDKLVGVLSEGVSPITTERTIVEHDAMGNIAIVNVTSVEGSQTTYSKDDVPDWFYNSEQSNAIILQDKGMSNELWVSQTGGKSGISGIDQLDGMQGPNQLGLQIKEHNDSVDEDEQSDFFTTRYVVDTEKLTKEADELADALLAAIRP